MARGRKKTVEQVEWDPEQIISDLKIQLRVIDEEIGILKENKKIVESRLNDFKNFQKILQKNS